MQNSVAAPTLPGRSYFLQRQLWRSALWGVLGTVAIVATIAALDAAGLKAPKAPPVIQVAPFFVAIGIFIAQYLLPRVRVDQEGIHRRILWWWDLWPWEDFTDGLVTYGTYRHGYRHTTKPFWSQRLELSVLEPEAAEEIDRLIKRVWTPPDPPECPETLVLTLKRPGRPVLTMTADGISFTHKNQTVTSSWDDLPMVTIWRLAADRPDSRTMIFELSDREIRLGRPVHNGQQLQTWSGPTAEVVSLFVMKHARRLRDYAIGGDARTFDELEAKREVQLGRLEKNLIVMRRMCWVIGALCAASPLVCPWPAAVMMSLYLAMPVGMYRSANSRLKEIRADLDRQQTALLEQAGSAAGLLQAS
ncbi:hypothetical protein [Caulifigura coniformis]|nr:hypothetical protein [Caulifigura coniformis]